MALGEPWILRWQIGDGMVLERMGLLELDLKLAPFWRLCQLVVPYSERGLPCAPAAYKVDWPRQSHESGLIGLCTYQCPASRG